VADLNDLITLAQLKEWLGISGTGEDSLLNRIGAEACRRVETYCGRTFASATYNEWLDGTGTRSLLLRNYPVTEVRRVCTGRATGALVKNTGSAQWASIEVTSTQCNLFEQGQSDVNLTLSTYSTLSALVTAINNQSNWEASAISGYESIPTSEIAPMPATDALGVNAALVVPAQEVTARLEKDRGELWRAGGWPAGRQNVFVSYTAGYSTIPPEIVQAVLELAALRYYRKAVDITVSSKRLGDYAVARQSGAGASSVAHLEEDAILRRISAWRRRVLV